MNSTRNNMNRISNSTSDPRRFNSTVPFFNKPNRPGFGNQSQNMDTTTAPILLGIGGALLFVTLALLTARLWSRLRPRTRLHADDWTVLGATILAVVNYILLSLSVVHGLGRRSRFVSFSRRRTALELLFISQVFWYWSITLVKLSVACLLLRVKTGHGQRGHRRWRIFLYFIMAILVLAAITQTVFQFSQCRPFRVFWDPRVFGKTKNGGGGVKCWPRTLINANIVAFSSIQVAVDLIFSFIPITFIRHLNRPRREKIFMCVLMALGLIASCAAIIRTLMLKEYYVSRDLFRTNVTISLWAVVEQQFAIVAATMPTLKGVAERGVVWLGAFFYDEGSEGRVRGRLVAMGLLGEEDRVRDGEKANAGGLAMDSPGVREKSVERKLRDEFGDTVTDTENDKEVEEMLARMAV